MTGSEELNRAIKFIDSVELASASAVQVVSLSGRAAAFKEDPDRGKYLGEPGKDGAAIIGPNLVSVLANLDEKNRRDVADQLEFASRYAKKKCNDEKKVEYWGYMQESLSNTGWFTQATHESHSEIHGTTVQKETMKDYVIDLVNADPMYSAEERALIASSLNALANQQNKLEFFRPFTASDRHGEFSVASVTVTQGALALRMTGFYFAVDGSVKDYIIVKLKTINAEVGKFNTDYAANQRTIDHVRDKIEEKLNQKSDDFIDNVEI